MAQPQDAARADVDEEEVLRERVVLDVDDGPRVGRERLVAGERTRRGDGCRGEPARAVVRVEHPPAEGRRVARAAVDAPADDRTPGAAGRDRQAGRPVAPLEGRRGDAVGDRRTHGLPARRVGVAADAELHADALEARPAEVAAAADLADLLEAPPADVAVVDHAGVARGRVRAARGDVDREAEGVAQAHRPHPRGVVGRVARPERVRRQAEARFGVHAEDLAREARHEEATEGADVLGGREFARPEAVRVEPPRVHGVVGGAVAGADEQRAVAAEGQRADGVREVARRDARRERLADEDLPRGRVDGARRCQRVPRDAAEGVRSLRVRAVDRDDVGEVDPAVSGEVGVDGDAEQAAVALVEDLRLEVQDLPADAVLDEVEPAALLGDQHPAVGQERHIGRHDEAARGDLGVEADRERLLEARGRAREVRQGEAVGEVGEEEPRRLCSDGRCEPHSGEQERERVPNGHSRGCEDGVSGRGGNRARIVSERIGRFERVLTATSKPTQGRARVAAGA